LIIDIFGVVWT